MAYVSIRVTPQSTAQTVVLEVLPLFGRQVCMLGPPSSDRPGDSLPSGPCRCPLRCPGEVARPDAFPALQVEGPESFQLVEVLMGSKQGG